MNKMNCIQPVCAYLEHKGKQPKIQQCAVGQNMTLFTHKYHLPAKKVLGRQQQNAHQACVCSTRMEACCLFTQLSAHGPQMNNRRVNQPAYRVNSWLTFLRLAMLAACFSLSSCSIRRMRSPSLFSISTLRTRTCRFCVCT